MSLCTRESIPISLLEQWLGIVMVIVAIVFGFEHTDGRSSSDYFFEDFFLSPEDFFDECDDFFLVDSFLSFSTESL